MLLWTWRRLFGSKDIDFISSDKRIWILSAGNLDHGRWTLFSFKSFWNQLVSRISLTHSLEINKWCWKGRWWKWMFDLTHLQLLIACQPFPDSFLKPLALTNVTDWYLLILYCAYPGIGNNNRGIVWLANVALKETGCLKTEREPYFTKSWGL